MNFEKFVYLLNNGLFCPKSSLFQDPWEGLLALPDKQNDEKYINNFSKSREWIYVSCWHIETAESYAMWKIYGEHQNSVCIETHRSTLESIVEKCNLGQAIYTCEVIYGALNERIQGPAFTILKEPRADLKNVPWPYAMNHGIKHDAYSFEKEYRLIILDEKFNLDLPNDSHGLNINFTPKELIEDITISPNAPDWFYKIVNDVSSKYDLKIKIKKSVLGLKNKS